MVIFHIVRLFAHTRARAHRRERRRPTDLPLFPISVVEAITEKFSVIGFFSFSQISWGTEQLTYILEHTVRMTAQ